MSEHTIYCERRWRTTINDPAGKIYLSATATFSKYDANFTPHFAITGTFRQGDFECQGAIHDQLIKHLPETKPLCRIHLSDHLGRPLHAYANAAYFAGQTAYPEAKNLKTLASHLRTIESHAEVMVAQAEEILENDPNQKPSQVWETLCQWHYLHLRWERQASQALALIQSAEGGKTLNRIPTEFIPKENQ